ncbi:MAG: hypothetical protein V1709_09460 [Planctomycetota bacterium]
MSKSIHDEIAERLARKMGTEYKSTKGIDIVTRNKVIEVETKKDSLPQGIRQVEHSQKARYLAVNKQNLKNALEATKDTGIGVLGPTGIIHKQASRKG